MNKLKWITTLIVIFCSTSVFAASFPKAEMLYSHGLKEEAQLELIDLIFDDETSDTDIAKSYYFLGTIAFENDEASLAVRTWRELVELYPNSDQAMLVVDRIDELAGMVGDSLKESVNNAVALSYLHHGDFWSRGKARINTIDSSWISNVESAIKWYDKVIKEFPGTTAAKVAYVGKIRTLLGWEDPGRYGDKHGILGDFNQYMPLLLNTFESFENDFPDSPSLQAFRYQIAQGYWKNKDWNNTRQWLQQIIQVAGDDDSFYKDLAIRRLNKVEY